MNRNLILMLFLSSLLGCTETKTFVITPIERMPTSSKKVPVKKYKATVVTTDSSGRKTPVKTPNYVEILQIGSSIDANGDLVGPHKLYRVVYTSRWEIGPPKNNLPVPLKPKSDTGDQQVIEKAREAAREEVRSAMARTVQVSNPKSADPNNSEAYQESLSENPSPEKRSEIQSQFSIYPQNPTPPNP